MNMLVFSDVHLNEDSADVVLGKILPGIRDAALKMRIKDLAMLGDLWHVRYRVDVRIQNALRDELKQWEEADLNLRILPGNHDQVDRAGRNALEVFDDLRKVKVYTEPTVDGDGLWVPYRKRVEDVAVILEQRAGQSMNLEGKRVCWAHAAIQGSMMNDCRADTDGLPRALFDQFDEVLLGHYHKRQTFGRTIDKASGPRFWYVGSVRQVTLNEAGQDKGFAVWNGEELQYFTTEWAPKLYRFEIEKGQKLDLSGIKAGDDVRVIAGPGVDIEKLGMMLNQMGVQHTVTPVVEATSQRLSVAENASLAQYAEAYVDRIAPDNLDKGLLMQAFQSIVEKETA